MVPGQLHPHEMGDTLQFVSRIKLLLLKAHIFLWLPSSIWNMKDKTGNWLQGSAKLIGDRGAKRIARYISGLI